MRALLASISAATALLTAPGLASASIPTGSFEIQFGGLQSIWMGEEGVDSGEQFCSGFEASFDVLEFCDFQAFVDGKGRIYGYLEFAGWSGGLHFAEGGPIKGTQRGSDRSGLSRFGLSIRLRGVATDGFATASTRSSIRLSGQTTADGLMSGVWAVRVCVRGAGCSESESPVEPEIATNGEWSLAIDITDEGGGELGGGARVELGDGSQCYFAVSGRYSERRDTASLRLMPTEPDCKGTSIRLRDVQGVPSPLRGFLSTADGLSGSISYRLFGFRGATDFGQLPVLMPVSLPVTRQPFPVLGGAQVGIIGTLGGQQSSSSVSMRAVLIGLEMEAAPLRPRLEEIAPSSNQELLAFICEGTVAIAASVDPSSCGWAIPNSPDDLAARQWALLEELERARVPLDEPEASFGRRSFTWVAEETAVGSP